jgi:GT2 family glycosyltransferase
MNGALTLNAALETVATQEIPRLKVLVYDNGSADGTAEMLKKQIENKWWKPELIELKLIETTERSGGRTLNIPFMRHRLSQEAETEYVFFLDQDVQLPVLALKKVIEEFEKKEYVGMIGIRYEPTADHVQMGATLMKTEIAKKIKWQMTADACECLNCIKELQNLGLVSEYHPYLQARHIKFI